MEDSHHNGIDSEQTIEFVHQAGQFIETLIQSGSLKRSELLKKLQVQLPDLYIRALQLPRVASIFEESNQKFVTEEEYDHLKDHLTLKFGYLNDYLEIVEPDFSEADGPVPATLAEDMADIYQDLKDFLMLYQVGDEDIMNDAIWECRLNFERYWGQKLLNSLRQIHKILNATDPIQEDETHTLDSERSFTIDTNAWFISQRQKDFQDSDGAD